MYHLEKLATLGTQDDDKQNKNTTQYVLDTTMPKQYSVHIDWLAMVRRSNMIIVVVYFIISNNFFII
jgi:hypothetical protein